MVQESRHICFSNISWYIIPRVSVTWLVSNLQLLNKKLRALTISLLARLNRSGNLRRVILNKSDQIKLDWMRQWSHSTCGFLLRYREFETGSVCKCNSFFTNSSFLLDIHYTLWYIAKADIATFCEYFLLP